MAQYHTGAKAQPSKLPRWAGYLFSSTFILVGTVLLYIITIRPLWSIWNGRNWIPTPCTVVSSKLKEHRGDSVSYTIAIYRESSASWWAMTTSLRAST